MFCIALIVVDTFFQGLNNEYGAFTMWDLGKVVGSAFGYRYETWIEDA